MADPRIPEWTLGDRLAKARRVAGLTQAELAELLQVARVTVGNYEAGRSHPHPSIVVMWSEITGVDLDWLDSTNPLPVGAAASA